MSVDPETTAAHMRARRDAQRRAGEARADAARAVAGRLAAALLARFGARRVFLHGSLAHGGFHERSDIDLAVDGLSPAALLDAAVALDEEAAPFTVDLVRLERLPTRWREAIEQRGDRLP